MPRTRAAAAATKTETPEETTERGKAVDSEIEVQTENDLDETIEEEVEYEEVEKEVEEEVEDEEVEEEIEEEVEEEEEDEAEDEEEEEEVEDDEASVKKVGTDVEMNEGDGTKKHAELLALPPHGSEVFIGGFPHDTAEQELRSFCESIGEIAEIRIMKSKEPGKNKGYAFVMFRTKDLASKAMEQLNNKELKGKLIKCSKSQAKHKLFVGNIPKSWGEEDLRKVVSEVGPGVNIIELVKDPQNSNRNRGFAFIEYYNHACAEYSRQQMSVPKFKLGDNSPTVSWADTKNAESSASSQVKAIYIKNLPKSVTDDKLKDMFGKHGKITKVVLPPAKVGHENRRFGFVHFNDRLCALEAARNTEICELDGQVLDCSLAKPQTDQKSSGGSSSQKSAVMPSYPPPVGYGMVGGGYGDIGVGYGSPALAQPLLYGGRGSAPAGMAMMPMLLPDGRIGYVLQQPGMQPYAAPQQPRDGGRGGVGGRGRGRGRGRGNDRGRGRSRYNPY